MLKKAKPLNKLRPDKCGSPFAVRVLAFLTTSLSAWRSVVSFLQSEEKGSSRKKNVGASSNKMKKMILRLIYGAASIFKLEVALVDKGLPMSTPDDFGALVAGHLKHQVCQLLEPGPVNLLPVHAQRV